MPKNALICPYMPNPQNHKSNNKDLTCHPRTSLKHRTLMPPLTTLKNHLPCFQSVDIPPLAPPLQTGSKTKPVIFFSSSNEISKVRLTSPLN